VPSQNRPRCRGDKHPASFQRERLTRWLGLFLLGWLPGPSAAVAREGGESNWDTCPRSSEIAEPTSGTTYRQDSAPSWYRLAAEESSRACDELPPVIAPDQRATELEGRLANWGRVYRSDQNPTLQELWLLGRYHGQQHWSDGSAGSNSGWENRRYRMGGQARLFEHLTLHAQMVSGVDLEPFYNGFTELWAQWSFCEELALTVGQQKHRFTHDRNVSSRYITTLERSQLVNMFAADYTPAITLQGEVDRLSYYTGIFSNATGRDMWTAMTEFDSGYSLLATAYLDVSERLPADSAHVGLSYLLSDANENATNLNVFGHGISNVLILTRGSISLVSEGVIGLDSAQGDAFGVNVQAGYFLTDRWQLASRGQLAVADQSEGLLPQLRYERPAGLDRGDRYRAIYLGANYYAAGNRLKWLSGLEYSDMNGASLWTLSTAVRIFWGPHSNGPFPMAQTLPGRFGRH
jgi:phosphate-selective porin OprO/OprP